MSDMQIREEMPGSLIDVGAKRQSVSVSHDDGMVNEVLNTMEIVEKNPVEFAKDLDLNFYGSYYQDLAELAPDQLERHWSETGQREGRYANLATLIRAHAAELPADFDIGGYLALNPDVAADSAHPWQALLHYLKFGKSEGRQYQVVYPNGVSPEPAKVRTERPVQPEATEEDFLPLDSLPSGPQPSINGEGRSVTPQLSVTVTPDELDASFYTSYYRDDLGTLSASEAVHHWLSHGRVEGRFSNVEAMIRHHKNGRLFPPDFTIGGYLSANTDLIGKFSNDWEYIRHYLEVGVPEARKYHVGTIDFDFIETLYGISLQDDALNGEQVVADDSENQEFLEWRRTEIRAEIRRHIGSQKVYLDLSSMLFGHGIYNTQIVKLFDFEYYFYKNAILRQALEKPSAAKCLLHFCSVGMGLGLPFSELYSFDYDFYIDRYRRIGKLPLKEAYLHWINIGHPQGWAPNGHLWLQNELGITIPDPNILDIELYRRANKDLAAISDRCNLIVHLLKEGVRETRYSVKPTSADAGIFTAIADQLSIRGDYTGANVLYEKILDQVPNAIEARQHYADNLFRQNQYLAAAEFYKTLIDRNESNVWSFINLASCYRAIGDLQQALFALRDGSLRYPHDVSLRRQVRDATDHYFGSEWDLAWLEAELGRVAACHDRIRRLCQDITPRLGDRSPTRSIESIAIVGDEALSQCRLYRIEQKIEQLFAAGFDVDRYEFTKDINGFLENISRYQAVIFYRVPAFPRIIEAIIRSRELGLVTIYEIDDLIFDPEHYPPALGSYRGQVTSEEYAGLIAGVPAFAHAMSLCDYGIASTPALAREMSKIIRNGQVFVHRNALGGRHEAALLLPVPPKVDGRVVIFYGSGTKAHKEDFEQLIEPTLIELVKIFGEKISIVTAGYISWTRASDTIRNNIIQIGLTPDVEAYWSLLRTADINIAVLKPSCMADCKSELKWLEAGMFGVPSVVSRTDTFAGVIEDGVTGFLCRNRREWVAAVRRLVEDPQLRHRVGAAAKRAVLDRYNRGVMKENLANIFATVAPPRAPRPKIVLVNVFYPPQAKGGATRVVHDNVGILNSKYGEEFDIEVFCTLEGGAMPYETHVYAQEGVRVTTVTTPDDPLIDHKLFDKRMGDIFDEYLEAVSPELVHFHCVQRLTVAVIDATRRRNIPYFITAHDGYWISNRQFIIDHNDQLELYDYHNPIAIMKSLGREAQLRMSVCEKALQGARNVLCVSHAFARLYQECNVPNVMALPNGVSALPLAVRTRSNSDRVRLAHLGGAMRHKGLHLIKYALLGENFSHLALTVVDHAQSAGTSRREIWGTTPVEFIGIVPQKDVGELYAKIDVLLAPSIWPESYGLVTREAFACGCWVVASDRGAVSEYVVDGENGHVVDVSDVTGLIRVLHIIDNDHERYLESPRTVPQIRLASEQADDLAGLYRSVVAKPHSKSSTPTTAAVPMRQQVVVKTDRNANGHAKRQRRAARPHA